MKKLTISDAEVIIHVLQDEIRHAKEARYGHRLHGILLVAQGMSCSEVAKLLGDAPRTVQFWVRRFEEEGLSGLVEDGKPGRPARLSSEHLETIALILKRPPYEAGMSGKVWDGKVLSAFIQKEWGLVLGMRQCQRLFRRLGFRYRKPRPGMAPADPEE